MRRLQLLLIIFGLLSTGSYAQSWKAARFEVYGGATAYQYFGDIGGASGESNFFGLADISLFKTRPGISIGARYHFSKPIQFKTTFSTGIIAQSDANSRNETRGYAFSTLINELLVMGEYYIIPESEDNYYYNIMQIRGGLRHFRQPFSVYLTFGFGGIHYLVTPREKLATSPRFSQSSNLAFIVPMGGGVKYSFLPRMYIGVEIIGRLTSTNELDGFASPKGEFNDLYHSITFKFGYKIQQSRRKAVGLPRKKLFF